MLETLSPQKYPKLLAPAGSKEAFKVALLMGADEIFLGLKQFNARKRAENFSLEELEELVPLASQYGCKILVTVNIVIQQKELDALVPFLDRLEKIGIGAVIVQDLGVARLIQKNFPNLRMHASTQLAIHNHHGVEEAIRLGFKRVVLAREMTLQEIRKIRSVYSSDVIELETFCHGSLCYSYSGLCFFSGAEGGRSGNRGECAYTCRKPYKILSEPGHGFLFSMKDLDTVDMLDEFVKAGVDSLKIEGRKKDAQYVATTVKRYREALDRLQGKKETAGKRFKGAAALFDILDEGRFFSYQRSPTTLFFKNRYEENVIDLNSPTHQGVELGEVKRVEKRKIYFDSLLSLEAHDGVRIESKNPLYHARPQHGEQMLSNTMGLMNRYENKEISFSVEEIFVGDKRLFSHPGKRELGLMLPKGSYIPSVGDKIFKTRSNALKRAVDQLLGEPLKKVASRETLNLEVNWDEKTGTFLFKVSKGAKELFQLVKECTLMPSPSEEGLRQSFIDVFQLLGEIKTSLEIKVLQIPPFTFVAKSVLKEWKRELVEALRGLESLYQPLQFKDVPKDGAGLAGVQNHPQPKWILKIDREELSPFLDLEGEMLPDEVIFEPKKAFLEKSGPALLERLVESARTKNILLRVALPLILRSWDEPYIRSMIRYALDLGVRHFECPNIGALSFLNKEACGIPLDISADFAIYALNAQAITQLKEMGFSQATFSIEDDKENIFELLNQGVQPFMKMILYKDIPLFIAESCSLTALHGGCPTSKVCGYRTLEIEGEDKERYEVHHELCKSVVLSKKPFSLVPHLNQLVKRGVKSFQFDFLTKRYSFAEALEIFKNGKKGISVNECTDSNFMKKLL
jgi:putative protease